MNDTYRQSVDIHIVKHDYFFPVSFAIILNPGCIVELFGEL